MAEIEAGRQRNRDFARVFIASACDLHSLPLRAFSHNDGGFPQSLDEAIEQADIVVTGRVVDTRLTAQDDRLPFGLADSIVAVDQILKGSVSGEIVLHQEGGPVRTYDGGAIGYLEGDPVLLPGDEVILLAREIPGGGGYSALYPVGKYYIRDGAVHTPDGNPCDSIDGLTEADVFSAIKASLKHKPPARSLTGRCNWERFR